MSVTFSSLDSLKPILTSVSETTGMVRFSSLTGPGVSRASTTHAMTSRIGISAGHNGGSPSYGVLTADDVRAQHDFCPDEHPFSDRRLTDIQLGWLRIVTPRKTQALA